MYATQLGRSRAGVLTTAADLFALFGFGLRDGQRRYFTYSLLPDRWGLACYREAGDCCTARGSMLQAAA